LGQKRLISPTFLQLGGGKVALGGGKIIGTTIEKTTF
jgi:hypothetical protein